MKVIKRNSTIVDVEFDEITKKIKQFANKKPKLNIDAAKLAMEVISLIYDGITTSELDEFTASMAINKSLYNSDYSELASRLIINNHMKNTNHSFKECVLKLNNLISEDLITLTTQYEKKINEIIIPERDYLLSYFGFNTLKKSYLLKDENGTTLERPQYLYMRVALSIHTNDFEKVKETYDLLSLNYFTHATPTLFNAGTKFPQMSSCFLIGTEDSVNSIYKTISDVANISKWAGGIGVHISNIRASGSIIGSTNGTSQGLMPMLKVYNDTARYINQGSRRLGSFAIYLEPWHADIFTFLEAKKNNGADEIRARDLFYGLWIPDIFMERLRESGVWSLMCPYECPGLTDCHSEEFEKLYTKYESEGKYKKQINILELWNVIINSQIETGLPYMCYKDSVNKKSNQSNLGTIKSSNLCCVEGTTKILTDKGHIEIKNLVNENVNIWNGEEFSESSVFKTSDASEVITILFSDGVKLECTKNHKFRINLNKNGKTIDIEAKDIKIGDKIVKCNYPIIDNNTELKFSYTNGFFCGDGTYSNCKNSPTNCKFKSMNGHKTCKRHINYENLIDTNNESVMCQAKSYLKNPIVVLYEDKIKLLNELDYNSYGNIKTYVNNNEIKQSITVTLSKELKDKFFVPINYSLKSKLSWFSGYCDADGCISNNNGCQTLQICSIHKDFLNNIKLMLQTCGINSKVLNCMNERNVLLPDGKGNNKEYNCKRLYRLLVASNELQLLLKLGLSCKSLVIENRKSQRNATKFIKVIDIIETGKICETYCFNEPKKHMGIFNGIYSHNCEIMQYSDSNETAVCNLASICLPKFVKNGQFDYNSLGQTTEVIVNNLNIIINKNFYPTPECQKSNFKNRPIGIGVQGLADVFMILNIPFTSDRAKKINKKIFETIYYYSLKKSNQLAIEYGKYSTFDGSPASKGILQYNLWNKNPELYSYDEWNDLKEKIKKHGLRNSLLVAPMPTASTAQIMGNNESIEPYTSNIYTRRVLSGEYIIINKHLIHYLKQNNLMNKNIIDSIILQKGSVQHLNIPNKKKEIFKTSWEISQKKLLEMSADRGAFICQSQSLNIFIEKADPKIISSVHLYGHSLGLKTGSYYIRTKPVLSAQNYSMEHKVEKKEMICTDEVCTMCSS